SGIAIVIGTMVDMGIIMTENVMRHLKEAPPNKKSILVIYDAAAEVGGAILTAISTTIISLLSVFFMTGPEGKLFKPLAFTEVFSLFGSVVVALVFIPLFCYLLFRTDKEKSLKGVEIAKYAFYYILAIFGISIQWIVGIILFLFALWKTFEKRISEEKKEYAAYFLTAITVMVTVYWLTSRVMPLGRNMGIFLNLLFMGGMIGMIITGLRLFIIIYPRILAFLLDHKKSFMVLPFTIILLGIFIWLGFGKLLNRPVQKLGLGFLTRTSAWKSLEKAFPGLGKEFMPDLDEGSYLWMPTTMPHASLGEVMDILKKQDVAIRQIPEIKMVVGKLGRVESPLDPAPVSMIETIILYKKEYRYGRGYLFDGKLSWISSLDQKRIPKDLLKSLEDFEVTLYKPSLEVIQKGAKWILHNNGTGYTLQKEGKELKVYEEKKWVRQWRPHIKNKEDIWNEITKAAEITGSTTAPKLQPIAARIVMLQTGMRAPMGIKVKGKDLKEIEAVGLQIERFLKEVPSVEPAAVNADRIIGKPYLEFVLNREKMARYGVNIRDVQDIIEIAIGGKRITTTVEGRERYPVRVRYKRELRDTIKAMERILVPTRRGTQVPLSMVAKLRYVRGPQVIKSEDTFLVGYVLFDKKPGYAEVDVVEACQKYLKKKLKTGEFKLPKGTTYE
ncbi:MAG: efflux RND transporter permease subunit, partial [Planctomycetota bacterium]